MKWIIEAGTTKTDSLVISPNNDIHHQVSSTGLNPVSDPYFQDKLEQLCQKHTTIPIDEIYYYGSGCINDMVNTKIEEVLKSYIPEARKIVVEDDLLGAALSTCGNRPGIALILGTGSNIGYFDGVSIADRVTSGGYLLGDEGGGFRIGQNIYLRYCRGLLTKDETDIVTSGHQLTPKSAVHRLYQEDNPRQYLASFSRYINQMTDHTQELILNHVFDNLLEGMVLPLWRNHPVEIHLVGSISCHFKDRLVDMLGKFNIIAGSFVKSPIKGLKHYHRYEQNQ